MVRTMACADEGGGALAAAASCEGVTGGATGANEALAEAALAGAGLLATGGRTGSGDADGGWAAAVFWGSEAAG